MRAPAEVNDAFLDRLLLALEELDAPVVVVLEDLHEVSAPEPSARSTPWCGCSPTASTW